MSKEKLYTARWYNKEIEKAVNTINIDRAKSLVKDQHEVLTDLIEGGDTKEVITTPAPVPVKVEFPKDPIDRTDLEREEKTAKGANLPWIPWAKIKKDGLPSSTRYPKGYPEGLVVHFTAGNYRGKDNATGTMEYAKSMGYGFMCLDTDGTLHQWQDLRTSDSHAGVSAWVIDGVKVESVSSRFLGVEINNPGRLELHQGKYYAWFDLTKDSAGKVIKAKNPIEPKDCRIFASNKENILAGAYLPYTKAQEETLVRLCLWLKNNNPSVFSLNYVVGHDEVAGPAGIGRWRKNDPGGALSSTMPEFRKKLIKLYGGA